MMSDLVIRAENISKQYRLGVIGRRTLHEDLSCWWARLRGRPHPFLGLDEVLSMGAHVGDHEHVWALRDIDFDVHRGDVLGVIGHNGSGKSTLLKLLSRVTAPTTGSMKMKGRVASLLEVGTGFHQELTGRENIFLNGAILGMTRAEVLRNLDAIVDFSGISKYIDTPVKRYSSGMHVRLAFSVAAHLEADILLVDEVLAVGDAEFRKQCIGKMKNVAGHGRTVLFVSHNMGVISRLTQRCLVLEKGRVVFDGDTEKAVERCIGDRRETMITGRVAIEDLVYRERVIGDPGAVFRAVGLTSVHDGVQPFGSPLEVELDVMVDQPRSLIVGYTICNSLEESLVSGWSQPWEVERKGQDSIRLNLCDLGLAPGHYCMNISLQDAIRRDVRRPHDVILGWGHFDVETLDARGSLLDEWSPAWGTIVHSKSELVPMKRDEPKGLA